MNAEPPDGTGQEGCFFELSRLSIVALPPVVLTVLLIAIREVARIVDADAIDCGWERRDHIAYTTDPSRADQVEHEAELAARLGLPAAASPTTDLPFGVTAAVRFADQAQFQSRAYCLGLARAIVEGGGRVHAHTRARQIDDGIVVTDHGELQADAIVVATHLPIKEMGGYFARTEAFRSYALAVTVDGGRPEDMYISVDQPTRSLRTAADHLIVGGEGHGVGDDHDTTEHYRNLEAWARQHFTVRSVDYRWSAQDWSSADGLPYIGRMPGHGEAMSHSSPRRGINPDADAGVMELSDDVEDIQHFLGQCRAVRFWEREALVKLTSGGPAVTPRLGNAKAGGIVTTRPRTCGAMRSCRESAESPRSQHGTGTPS